MKKSFAVLFAALFMALGVISCGDDPVEPDDGGTVNLSFKFKAGDTFTYDYYDRDENNDPDQDSKKVIVWTVLNTDVSIGGRSGVAEIQQIRYEADAVTAIDTSTVYFLTNSQAQVLQYNLFQNILTQFSGSVDLSTVISQISDNWIQVGDTKSPSALTWDFSGIVKTIQDVSVAGVIELDIKVEMSVNSSHKGRESVTVPAGTYASAYVTDHEVPTVITAAEDKELTLPPVSIENGDVLIQDAADLHYAIDIEAGIVSMSMDSHATTLVPVQAPYPINGFEMNLTSYTRAE